MTAAQLNEQLRDNGNEYIQRGGTVPLTASWDAGSFEIRAQTFFSDASAGVAPLTISSSTVVTNLNADMVDGQNRALNINADHTHQSTGAQGGQLDHGAALTGLTDDDHPQYVLESLFTAQGAIIYAASPSTPATLPAGTAGQYLQMSSASVPQWVGGTWVTQVASQSKVIGTTYQNTDANPRFINVALQAGGAGFHSAVIGSTSSPALLIDKKSVDGSSPFSTLHFIALPNWYYKVVDSATNSSIQNWVEWTG